MKCIQCGTSAEAAEHLCEQCFLERYTNVTGIKEFVLLYCANCGRYTATGRWNPRLHLKDALAKAMKAAITTKSRPTEIIIEPHLSETECSVGTKLKILVDIRVTTIIHGLTKNEQFSIPLKITFMLCPLCEHSQQEYFQGIIQLRNKASHQFDAAVQFIADEIHKQKQKGVFITKVEETRDGLDLYCSQQRYLPIIAKKIYARFGGECTTHTRNFTLDKQTSKQVYRVNALLRLPSFGTGDVISVGKRMIQVETVFGNKVSGIDLALHKKILVQYDEYKILVPHNEVVEMMVTKHKPTLEVLDPVTYQSVAVMNPQPVTSNIIKCIRIHEQVWMVYKARHIDNCTI